jgi:fibro-slime domain-containing protein
MKQGTGEAMQLNQPSDEPTAARDPSRHHLTHLWPAHAQGMAVLLALVAVGLALMIGLAVSTTRDSNTSASGGLVLATSSRSASAGALDIADFIVRRHSQSVAGAPASDAQFVFEPKPIGNFTLSASMRDPTTGRAPTAESVGLALSASAASGAVTQSSSETVRIDWGDAEDRVDLDLSEFALLTSARTSPTPTIQVGPGSEVSVWRKAPLARLGEPVLIGTRLRDANLISIDPQARALGYAIVRPGDFAPNRDQFDEQLANREFRIPAEISIPSTPWQGVPTTITVIPWAQFAGQVNRPLADGTLPHVQTGVPNPSQVVRGSRVTIAATAVASLQPNALLPVGTWRVIHISNQTQLQNARWRFEVPTLLIVSSNLLLTDSEFIVGPNGALTIATWGRLQLRNSRIVPDDGNGTTSHAADGTADYGAFGASRIMVHTLNGDMTLESGSVLKGQVYSVGVPVRVESRSAVYGRILAARIDLRSGGSVYYDPQLDSGRGWSNPESGVWWRRNELRREVRDVSIFNDRQLATFVERTSLAVDFPENGIVVTQHVAAAGGTARSNSNIAQAGANTTASTSLAQSVPMSSSQVVYPDRYIVIHGTLRDFREASVSDGHPDFDNAALASTADRNWVASGLVESELSRDGKPVLKTERVRPLEQQHRDRLGRHIPWNLANRTVGDFIGRVRQTAFSYVSSPESFASWFRDAPGVNVAEPFRIVMNRVPTASGVQTYVFDSNSAQPFQWDGAGPQFDGFFPLENRLFGNSPLTPTRIGLNLVSMNRNYHFTLELNLEFTYRRGTGQAFAFNSDDDLWAFIDGKLAIDLGGMHNNASQVVELDRLGLEEGKTYPMKIFYAERRRPYAYFRMATTFPIASPIPAAPKASDPMGPFTIIDRQAELTRSNFLAKK